MSFIQGSVSSNEDLVEVVDTMSSMLTQGDYSAELWLELAMVKHKLDKLNNSELGGDVYKHVGILYALKSHLEDTLHELEEADKEPQEVGYDDVYEDKDLYEEEEGNGGENNHKLIIQFLKQAYHISDDEIREMRRLNDKKPQDVDNEGSGNEYEGLTAEAFLEELLEKINAKTEAEIRKLQNGNIGW